MFKNFRKSRENSTWKNPATRKKTLEPKIRPKKILKPENPKKIWEKSTWENLRTQFHSEKKFWNQKFAKKILRSRRISKNSGKIPPEKILDPKINKKNLEPRIWQDKKKKKKKKLKFQYSKKKKIRGKFHLEKS